MTQTASEMQEFKAVFAPIAESLKAFNVALPAAGIIGIVATWTGLRSYLDSHHAHWVLRHIALAGEEHSILIMGGLLFLVLYFYWMAPGVALLASRNFLHPRRDATFDGFAWGAWYDRTFLVTIAVFGSFPIPEEYVAQFNFSLFVAAMLHTRLRMYSLAASRSGATYCWTFFFSAFITTFGFLAIVLLDFIAARMVASYMPGSLLAHPGWGQPIHVMVALLLSMLVASAIRLGAVGLTFVMTAAMFLLLFFSPPGIYLGMALQDWGIGAFDARITSCGSERCAAIMDCTGGEVYLLIEVGGVLYLQTRDASRGFFLPSMDVTLGFPEAGSGSGHGDTRSPGVENKCPASASL